MLAGHSVADTDGHHAARMAQANSGRPAGLVPLGMGRENVLEARCLAAKPRDWWRPTEVPGENPESKWDSLVENISGSWNGARGWAQGSGPWPTGARGGMPTRGLGGDKGCSSADSHGFRLSDKLGEGITRDTGYPE